MATQSDITLDVLAALKLGSTGVVNQAEFIKQIEKQTAAMMKGVTIKGNEIVIDPKFKLNKKAMDGLTTELTRQIGALEKSFGQRATGDKLSGKLLAPLFGPGNAEKNVKAAELMANRINGLSDLQARKLQRYQRDVQGFLKVRNEMMSAQRDLRTLTSRDLATKEPQRFEKARALAERYRQSLTALNKTISAGGYDKAQIGKDKEGAPFIQASQQALNQSAKELRSIEKAFTQINKKAEAFAKSGLGIESQAEARRRNYQETQRAKLASGREALDKYGAKDLPREFMRTALASRKADLTRLESKRDGGELKGKELKAYGDQHRRLTSDISTLSSGLKDYRQETDLNRIAQKKAAKAATARLDSEKAAAKQATVDRRIKGYTAQRGVDVGGISDPARLRVLRDQSADALGATKGEIGKLEDIKRRTVAQKKLLQTYRSLREEITRHNLAIDKRVAGIKKETAATQKLQAELIKAAALRQQTARAARTALKAGVSGVGTDFGANSVYARRRKDMQEYVNQLNKLIKAEKGDTGRSQEQVRRLEAVRQGYVNAGDALTNYRANLKKTASASSTLRDRLGETGLLLKSFFRYALGYGALYQVIAAFRILITSVVSLNKELKSIQAIASATEEQMISVGAAIKSVATQTKFSVAEVAKAARILAQAGVAPEEINKTLKSVSQFAAGTETAIDTAADVVSTMRNVFKELDDVQIADKLTKAINISKLTGNDLKSILSISAQIGKSFELTADQYLSAVSTLRNAGLKATTVATGLRQGLLEIFNPDTKSLKALAARYAQIGEALNPRAIIKRFQAFRQASNPLIAALTELQRLGFTGEGKKTFARAFDIRAENAISAMINNLDKLQEAEARISLGGAASEASATQLESLANATANLGAAISVLSANISTDFVDSMQEMVKATTDSILSLDDLDLRLKSMGGEGVGGIFSAAGLGATAGALLTPGKAIAKVVGGIAGGVGAGYVAEKTLAKGAENEDAQGAEQALELMNNVLLFMGVLSLVKGKFPGLGLKSMKQTAAKAVSGIGRMIGLFTSLGAFFTGLKLAASRLVAFLGPVGVVASIVGAIWTIADYFMEAGQSAEDLTRQTKAAKEQSVRSKQKLDEEAAAYRDYQLTDEDKGIAAGKNTSADALERAMVSLHSSQAALSEKFLGNIESVEDFTEIMQQLSYGKGAEEGSNTRRELLARLERGVEKQLAAGGVDFDANLLNLDARNNRLLGELINTYTNSVTKVMAIAGGQLEKAKRLAGRQDLTGAEAAFQKTLTAELQAFPLLYRVWSGDPEAVGEIGGAQAVAEGLRAFYEKVAAEGDGLGTRVSKGMKIYGDRIATVLNEVSTKLANGEMTHQQAFNTLSAEVDTLSATGESAANNLQLLIEGINGQLEVLSDQSRVNKNKLAGAINRPNSRLIQKQLGLDDGRSQQERLATINQEVRGGQSKLVLEQNRRIAQGKLNTLNEAGESINKKTITAVDSLFIDLRQHMKKIVNDEAFSTKLTTGSPELQAAVTAAKNNQKAIFEEIVSRVDASASTQYGTSVRKLSRPGQQLQDSTEGYISREAVAKQRDLDRISQQKFKTDPYTALQVAALDREIKALQRVKSPELFGEGNPVREKFDLLIREAEKELALINDNIVQASVHGGTQQEYAKLETLKKQQVTAIEKMVKLDNDALKLQDAQKDIYERHLIKTKQREAAAEKGRLGEEIKDAVLDGGQQQLVDLQAQRLENARTLLELERQLMLKQGKEVGLVDSIIGARLAQLASAQASLAAGENIAQSKQRLYNIGTTPTTGSRQIDALRQASGLDFTEAEKLDSLTKSAKAYSAELQVMYALQSEAKGNPSVYQQYQREIDGLGESLGEIIGQMDHIETTGAEQFQRAFDPHRILTDVQNLDSAIQNLGDKTRQNIVGAFDTLGGSLVEAVIKGENAMDAIRGIFYNMFLNIAKDTANTMVNELMQGMLKGITGGADGEGGVVGGITSAIGGVFGGSGGGGGGRTFPVVGPGSGIDLAQTANVSALHANTAALYSTAGGGAGGGGPLGWAMGRANGGRTFPVVGPGSSSPITEGLDNVTASVDKVFAGQFMQTSQSSNFFSDLGGTFTSGISSLSSSLMNILPSLFGGGAASGAGTAITSLFSSAAGNASGAGPMMTSILGMSFKKGVANLRYADGAAGVGQGQGSVSPSGVISGPGTGLSDSISAALFGSRGVTPIAVATGESILNQGATNMLGEGFVNAWNHIGRSRRFAGGSVLTDPASMAKPAMLTSPAVNVNNPTKVVNVLDKSVMHDYATSPENEQVILNVISRNPRRVGSSIGG